MPTWINPYLTFRNTAAEAMTFYQSVFGGDLQTMTFGQGGGSDDPAKVDLLMHAHLETTGYYDRAYGSVRRNASGRLTTYILDEDLDD